MTIRQMCISHTEHTSGLVIFSPATSIAIRTALTVGQPDEPEIPTTIAGYMFGRDVVKELDIQQFDIQPFPGKGIGVVARDLTSPRAHCVCGEWAAKTLLAAWPPKAGRPKRQCRDSEVFRNAFSPGARSKQRKDRSRQPLAPSEEESDSEEPLFPPLSREAGKRLPETSPQSGDAKVSPENTLYLPLLTFS